MNDYKLNKLLEKILTESYEQEHTDSVMLAKENYISWLNLVIWDLLEIQNAFKKLTEATALQKYEHCLKVLDESETDYCLGARKQKKRIN
jgi:hypothetical protein